MIDAAGLIGRADVVLVTLDSLRLDTAEQALAAGQTPVLASLLPGGSWETRFTPGSFTLPAHQAFLAGFLPTPARPGRHPRLFAGRFDGAAGIGPGSFVFEEPDLPAAVAARGYHTICVGGVGFFTGRGALGSILPGLFAEHHWSPALGVRNIGSPQAQMRCAATTLDTLDAGRRAFLLLNVSATHPPTHMYLPGQPRDSVLSQQAALAAVDTALPELLDALRRRGPSLLILTADHGTCFGDDGYTGHGLAHPAVWTVPYAELVLAP